MRVHHFTLSALAAEAVNLCTVCMGCGIRAEMALDHLMEKFGEDGTVGDVVMRARCRECGGLLIAYPDLDPEP